MMNSDRFEKGLTDPGVAVDQIDYVMCTHLHLENSRWVPTFPKAKYIFADRKLAYWPSGLPSYIKPVQIRL